MSLDAVAIAGEIRAGRCSAVEATELALAAIAARDPDINSFTTVLADRAFDEARKIDRDLAGGVAVGPLAGAPFAVKNLFDVVGTLARSVRDLAVSFGALVDDAPSADAAGIDGLRLAVADGYFAGGGEPAALAAVSSLAVGLGVTRTVTLPRAREARAAAMVITATEGAHLHLESLRRRPADFDPMTRDRFLAGALVPARIYLDAQHFRYWFRARMREVFRTVDVVLAPATPFPAPLVGQREAVVDGETVLTQPYLGVYTQPLSFAGLPVLSVPVGAHDGLPLGVQLVAGHHAEGALLRVGAELEARGLAVLPEAPWR